jgi:hypothetical protein
MKKIKVYMGIPSIGERSDAQVYNLRRIEKDYGDKIEFVYPELFTRRMFHDFARNEIVKEFLATDCDILWFLDSDIVPPIHIIDLITKHNEKWMLAGAAYPVVLTENGERAPRIVYTAYNMYDGKLCPTEVPRSGQGFINGLATGCLFIKRGIFSLLKQPYFEFCYDDMSRSIIEGEDLNFCRRVTDLGYQFFTDWGMICRHYKVVDLLDLNNYAIDYANAKLQEYDRQIKGQIQALNNKVRGKMRPQPKKSNLILPDYLR